MDMEIFNPLDKRNLGVSIADAIFKKEVFPLKKLPSFNGAGIYAIYYKGDFPLYKNISEKNKKYFLQPIYAGKAIPEGGRKGGIGIDIPVGEYLWNIVVDGFGNHDPGSGRYNQQISSWDTIHPGRNWAKKLQKGKTVEEISKQILEFPQ
ncbi:MAG: Eco29kI family restriction endonuclease [Treponema sp.]|jgi:hypothetical protein|nr:Eco29kI family restriction endonuclease [Treponema sp.]